MNQRGLLHLFMFLLVPCLADAREIVVRNNNAAGAGSFREALAAANREPGLDRITFDLTRPQIPYGTWLLEVIDPVEIDGTLTAGSRRGERVEFIAPDTRWPVGLQFADGSSGSHLSGLRFSGFGTGLAFDGCHGCRVDSVDIAPSPARVPRGRIGIAIRNSRGVSIGADVRISGVMIGVQCEHSPGLTVRSSAIDSSFARQDLARCPIAPTRNAP